MNYKSGYSDYSTPPLYCLCTLSPPGEDGPAASMVCDIATSLAGASMVWPQSGRTYGWLNWRDGRQVHGLPDDTNIGTCLDSRPVVSLPPKPIGCLGITQRTATLVCSAGEFFLFH